MKTVRENGKGGRWSRMGRCTSQCSTVVRSTVVTAMTKVNGKHQILGPPSSPTPGAIDLKFGMFNYVRGVFKRCHLAAANPRMLKEGKKGRGQGHVTPLNFWALNANSSKMA